MEKRQRIAVVGCGVAGLTAAHILQRNHDVSIFERGRQLGGHTHTVRVPSGPDQGTPIDTGFIVCNDRTYPLFQRLLEQLQVRVQTSDMSFSYHDANTDFHYAGTGINGLFSQRRNLFRPSFWTMLRDINRFCRHAAKELEADAVPPVDIGEYSRNHGFSAAFNQWYLAPMMAAIWSASPTEAQRFPAEALLRFFKNHGLLSLRDRPVWQTVEGGSHAYVDAFQKQFRGNVHTCCPIQAVRRSDNGVLVVPEDGEALDFDRVVLATHADEALALLADPDELEKRLLTPWRYQDNQVVLHTDTTVLPRVKRAWASWNYSREVGAESEPSVSMTYYMNRLQRLQTTHQYCVTLNRRQPVDPQRVIADIHYSHPGYTFDSMATQAELPELNGRRNTYFCGSYFSYGFHEDAVRSGVNVGRSFGMDL